MYYKSPSFDDKYEWLRNQDRIVEKIIMPFFNLAPIIILHAASNLLPDSAAFEDLFNEINNILETTESISINDPKFLTPDSDKIFVSFFSNNNDPIIIRSQIQQVSWKVFKLDKELVRGLWANEAFIQLYCGYEVMERSSIQKDIFMLRNLIAQAISFPLVYPSLVSPPISSPMTSIQYFF
jgi:hypothetical protein